MTAVATPTPLPHAKPPGSIQAAWSYPAYRRVWLGQGLSMTGTWMQNVALPAYVQSRWDSGTLVGLMVFAQLGPMLLLSVPGSILANRLPRRPWLLTMPFVQMVSAFLLAALVAADGAFWTLFLANLLMGVANALNAPAFQASIPMLVDRRDLPGAISLNSAQLNGSRVVGPLIAGLLAVAGVTVSQLLLINAFTFVFIIGALARVDVPDVRRAAGRGWRQLTIGVKLARETPILARLLVAMTLFSFASLPFIGLFPTIAKTGFGMDTSSAGYSWLYAVFGGGALIGGLAIGTVFTKVDKKRLIAPSFVAFAVCLFAFGQLRTPGPSYPVAFALGTSYLLAVTSMATVFQQEMRDDERTFLMALWFMAFGGMVPIGNLVFGPVIDGIGPRWVLGFGAVAALVMAWWTRRPRLEAVRRSSVRKLKRNPLEAGDPAALHQHGVAGPD